MHDYIEKQNLLYNSSSNNNNSDDNDDNNDDDITNVCYTSHTNSIKTITTLEGAIVFIIIIVIR